jgi:hypothetical protein
MSDNSYEKVQFPYVVLNKYYIVISTENTFKSAPNDQTLIKVGKNVLSS